MENRPNNVHKPLHAKDQGRAGRVEVTLSTDLPHFIEVSVFSAVRPAFLRTVKVADQKADDRNLKACMIAAGAAAEHLCEEYRDRLDPEECAKTAGRIFRDALLMLRLEEQKEAAGREAVH